MEHARGERLQALTGSLDHLEPLLLFWLRKLLSSALQGGGGQGNHRQRSTEFMAHGGEEFQQEGKVLLQ